MSIYGSRVRNACVIIFDVAVLVAFPCHGIESHWFWGGLGAVLVLSSLTVIALEIIRLVAPDFASNWWDPE